MSGFGRLPQSSSFGGFGSSPNTNNSNFAPNSAFPQQPQQQQQPIVFGTAPGFGNSSQAQPPQQNQPFQSSTFGGPPQSQPQQSFPSSGFGQQSTTIAFGSSPNIGMSQPPYNGGGDRSNTFGNQRTVNSSFAGGQLGSNAPMSSGPFSVTNNAANAPPISFGVSNSIATTSMNVETQPSAVSFGPQSTTPFGAPAPSAGPFAKRPQQPAFGNTGGVGSTGFGSSPFDRNSRKPKPKPKNTPFGPPGVAARNETGDEQMSDSEDNPTKSLEAVRASLDAKKAKLQKLQEKKKREEEEKKKRTALSAQATPFVPRTTQPRGSSRSPKPMRSLSPAPARSQLPGDLQNAPLSPNTTPIAPTERENLNDAVALVGLCLCMCPDEEILRRESESDVQLLERPDPAIHPPNWTLRDTMIKRFRRSAADFKLDIPELIRPPDVLERVCGYLEEWIMDRDRQGPDPRSKNAELLPLDVYQFVWDRTRMVRKDFILQNYVGGASGLCDARAVRCHERIARWHCMCEHQLSHIPEFATQQSQQNIQELGQTIKSLNQFYDDPKNRSLVEVPDEFGNETRKNIKDYGQGCEANTVQGNDPVDYNRVPLTNTNDPRSSRRLIGKLDQANRGTCEPEFRALYILQTMNNDGGLEVVKFASNLSQNKPEVFHSPPVQLALKIFKTIKSNNYIKFFSILRSSSTPYLFGCLMFKHVEFMRREAIRVCSITYGGRLSEKQVVGDLYPLKRFGALLCFESEDEAIAACQHYNITVKPGQDKKYYIRWRHSRFKEPIDPEKGTVIPFRPLKMINTIERKLHGATRLAVCRGQVSGNGAYLTAEQVATIIQRSQQRNQPTARSSRAAVQELFEIKQAAANRAKEEEAKKKAEDSKRRKREEEKKKKQEEKQQADLRAKQEATRVAERERDLLMAAKTKAEQEEKDRVEEQRRLEAEAIRRAEEEGRKLADAEKQKISQADAKKKRDEELRQQKIETIWKEANKEKLRLEHEAELRREQKEKEQLEKMRLETEKRQQLEEERWRRREEARKIKLAAAQRVQTAKQDLVFHLLQAKTRYMRPTRSASKYIPGFSASEQSSSLPPQQELPENKLNKIMLSAPGKRTRDSLVAALERGFTANSSDEHRKTPILLRIGVLFVPWKDGHEERRFDAAIRWLSSRIEFRTVLNLQRNVRIVFFDSRGYSKHEVCGGALVLLPFGNAASEEETKDRLEPISSSIADGIPYVVLSLREEEGTPVKSIRLGDKNQDVPIFQNNGLSLEALDSALGASVCALASSMSFQTQPTVERISAPMFFYECARRAVWHETIKEVRDDLLLYIQATIETAINHFHEVCTTVSEDDRVWPPREFCEGGVVKDYFSHGAHLPFDWLQTTTSKATKSAILAYLVLLGEAPLNKSLVMITDDAPSSVRDKVQNQLSRRLTKHCVETALLWRAERDEERETCAYIYLPPGCIGRVVESAVNSMDVKFAAPESAGVKDRTPIDCQIDDDECSRASETGGFSEEITLIPESGAQPTLAEAIPLKRRLDAISFQAKPRDSQRGRASIKIKRRRGLAKEKLENSEWTRNLERMASGETVNMLIGRNGSTLKSCLEGSPSLD